jgi:ribosomal protein L22
MAEKKRPDEEPEADAATEAAAAPDAEAPEETPAAEAATAEEAVEEPVAEASAGDDAASEPEAEAAAQPKPRRSRAKKAEQAEDDTAEEKPAPKRKAPARKKPAADKPEEPVAEEKPAARPQRPAGQRPVVRAQAKYVRTSARKARLVCDHIRGKSVDEARAILAHTPRAVSQDWSKLLESAVANAEHNHELVGDDLKIHAVFADEGPTIKRYRPRAMGRATPIRKRTSHLTIQLTVKE